MFMRDQHSVDLFDRYPDFLQPFANHFGTDPRIDQNFCRRRSEVDAVSFRSRGKGAKSFHLKKLDYEPIPKLEKMLFESFSTSFNAASWPTYSSMSYEAALKPV